VSRRVARPNVFAFEASFSSDRRREGRVRAEFVLRDPVRDFSRLP
jgi:hypothetical protein